MIRVSGELDEVLVGIPRESGDDPEPPPLTGGGPAYSPRERG